MTTLTKTNGAHSAFTLVELLVVIGVIGILAALLLPVTKVISDASIKSKCAANLRALGQVALLYAAEHQNNLVPLRMDPTGDPAGFWYDHLHEYVGRERGRAGRNVDGVLQHYPGFSCPLVNERYVINRICGAKSKEAVFASEPQRYLKLGQGFVGTSVIELPGRLAKTAWFADPMESDSEYFSPENYNGSNFIGFPHSDSANVLFMDGHIESIPDPDFSKNPSLLQEERWVQFFGKKP